MIVKTEHSARTFPTPVAADGSRRHFRCGKNAPTAVGGYILSAHPVPRITLRAFTLIELLTVIAIMGILAAITLPSIRSLKPNAKIAGTRQVLDAVGRARQLALSQRTTVYMVFLSTNFFTGLSPTNQSRVQPVLDKQLVGYAYVALRSVGDQPGVHIPRYLSSWKTLPQGAYIPLGKFWPGLTLTNVTLANVTFPSKVIPPFSTTNNLPFPTEDNPVNVAVTLPYIAFDGTGQLISGLSGQPELIPISEGSVGIARDPNTKVALPQPAQANEMPPGNTVENYSLVYIDRLTGRARVERRKVQ
jgi:prepilin-type N-terminal cleavage/methylation domain-containing protein